MNQMLMTLTMDKNKIAPTTIPAVAPNPSPIHQISKLSCVYCSGNHIHKSCPSNPTSVYHVRQGAQQNFDPYSNKHIQSAKLHST